MEASCAGERKSTVIRLTRYQVLKRETTEIPSVFSVASMDINRDDRNSSVYLPRSDDKLIRYYQTISDTFK